ncbi:unnamed protein product [Linum tenue]|uniref:Uncharacterized protein n=1 Tax=Linum tenue TaxID=586396 RepID=A0AAV0S1N6_9ROSI|nr:unnamed protein product [Linum tenue]CAI0627079.1 unnamed protein product [Linum tenue]
MCWWRALVAAAVAAAFCVGTGTGTAVNVVSKVEDAANFHIYYGQTFKVIKNVIDAKSYLLIQNNSRMAATRTKYCTQRIRSFVVPFSNFSADTYFFPEDGMQLLGLLGLLKGITTNAVASACALKLYGEGQITILNKDAPEDLMQFAAHFVTNTDQQQTYCNLADFLPFYEDHPLQRAEWIKFIGVFANLETRANQVYDMIKENYLCLAGAVANQSRPFKPVVAWLAFYNDIWSFTQDKSKLKYVEDAGGENIDTSINRITYNTSNPDDLEALHAILCQTVDVVIDETATLDPAAYTVSSFLDNVGVEDHSCFAFLTNQTLWRYDKRAYNSTLDWYDGAVSQPQLVLADLIQAFSSPGNASTTFLRNIAKGEGVLSIDGSMCGSQDFSTPMDPTILPCP